MKSIKQLLAEAAQKPDTIETGFLNDVKLYRVEVAALHQNVGLILKLFMLTLINPLSKYRKKSYIQLLTNM